MMSRQPREMEENFPQLWNAMIIYTRPKYINAFATIMQDDDDITVV